jgi:hypothetical protein
VSDVPARRGLTLALVAAALVGAAAITGLSFALDRATDTASVRRPVVNPHGTQAMPIEQAEMTSMARAFGIETEPVRTPTGWEAIDHVRSLYLHRAPSAWYVTFTNAAPLLDPPGDRASICASPDVAPPCRFSNAPLLAAVGGPSPSVETARRVAHGILTRAGVIDDSWREAVLEASPEPVTCRVRVATPLDCSQQILPARAVTFERYLRPGTTAMRWSLVVGPDGVVLSGSGRFVDLD